MNKEWLDLLVRVADNNNDAILILNDSLEIIFSNQTANSLFFIDESNIVLEQIFSSETVNLIVDQIGISKTENQNKSIKNLELILKSEEKLFLDLFIGSIKVEKKIHKVLLFSLLQEKSNPGDSTRLIVGDQTNFSPKQLEFINQLVKEIKNAPLVKRLTRLPFTEKIIGSNPIRCTIWEYRIAAIAAVL